MQPLNLFLGCIYCFFQKQQSSKTKFVKLNKTNKVDRKKIYRLCCIHATCFEQKYLLLKTIILDLVGWVNRGVWSFYRQIWTGRLANLRVLRYENLKKWFWQKIYLPLSKMDNGLTPFLWYFCQVNKGRELWINVYLRHA